MGTRQQSSGVVLWRRQPPACNLSHCSNSARRRISNSSILPLVTLWSTVFRCQWQRSMHCCSRGNLSGALFITTVVSSSSSGQVRQAREEGAFSPLRKGLGERTRTYSAQVLALSLSIASPLLRRQCLCQWQHWRAHTHSWAAEYRWLPPSVVGTECRRTPERPVAFTGSPRRPGKVRERVVNGMRAHVVSGERTREQVPVGAERQAPPSAFRHLFPPKQQLWRRVGGCRCLFSGWGSLSWGVSETQWSNKNGVKWGKSSKSGHRGR